MEYIEESIYGPMYTVLYYICMLQCIVFIPGRPPARCSVAAAHGSPGDWTGMASDKETSCNRLGKWGVASLGRGSRIHISAVCSSGTNYNTAVE